MYFITIPWSIYIYYVAFGRKAGNCKFSLLFYTTCNFICFAATTVVLVSSRQPHNAVYQVRVDTQELSNTKSYCKMAIYKDLIYSLLD